jgi:hypothetical protein
VSPFSSDMIVPQPFIDMQIAKIVNDFAVLCINIFRSLKLLFANIFAVPKSCFA